MKTGRNDPCPCGSGKKFKKCCLNKASTKTTVPLSIGPVGAQLPASISHPSNRAEASARPPEFVVRKRPRRPRDPDEEIRDAFWEEFKSQNGEGRRAIFLRTLDDKELMTDDTAFEMLVQLHEDAVESDERPRFPELLSALADRHPDVYQESALHYLSWRLQDAAVANSSDIIPLAHELAAYAGQNLDIVDQSLCMLEYHGHLTAVVEALRIAWPLVQASADLLPWGISEFTWKGIEYEQIYYLEHTLAPDPRDTGLLDRVKCYNADPDLDSLTKNLSDLAGQSACAWKLDDFVMTPVSEQSRNDGYEEEDGDEEEDGYEEDDGDEEEEEVAEAPDPGAQNLARLIAQFIGYLSREEQVPYSKGQLIRNFLFQHFIRRRRGDFDSIASLIDKVQNPKKKLPPLVFGHLLCPERLTFEVQLRRLVAFMSGNYHVAAALFQIVPAWLRFLESHGLIDADRHAMTLEDLRSLHADLLQMFKSYKDDPTLFRDLQSWPARVAGTDALAGPLV